MAWREDMNLKIEMENYVREGLQRSEILSFLERNLPHYKWSIRSLDRRLRFFEIFYNDKNVPVEDVVDAVQKELDGPGALLGYRAMHKKIRQEHNLKVPRDAVYTVMTHLDEEGLKTRGGVGKKKHERKGHFTTKSPNYVHSFDGHDKLMGYQNSTFPLAVYGCLDTASRKLLWLRIWVTNSDPRIVGRWYLEHLMEFKTISQMIRLDKGTETGVLATMHAFLRRNDGDMDAIDTILYGPSTSNQVSTGPAICCQRGNNEEGAKMYKRLMHIKIEFTGPQ